MRLGNDLGKVLADTVCDLSIDRELISFWDDSMFSDQTGLSVTNLRSLDDNLTAFCIFFVGPHFVHILMNGEAISGSPFTCNVHDVSKIKVTNLDVAPLGKQTTFSGKFGTMSL